MNIQEAKEEIRRAVSIYLMKDEFGNYRIPIEKQRPVFMIGAPGIGKTAVMEQIAKELDLSLVAYSMTHHTRQSALGLPFIVHKNYGGEEYDVSEYTMSEIIASVYENMEKSGKKEGILFLDEINCVSETLAPSMLQFLQYKTFGNHQVPSGWVVVTAGNPPEFNRSVREFDVVTLDRLKVLKVEADYETWNRYAAERSLHRAVRTYLEIRQEDFYAIDREGEERSYVTARGWEDLSQAITLYEEAGFPVTERLIHQYLRSTRIAGEFATYYELFTKYRGDYQIPEILDGREDPEIDERAKAAGFDERLTVTGLLTGALLPDLIRHMETEEHLKKALPILRELKQFSSSAADAEEVLASLDLSAGNALDEMHRLEAENGLTPRERRSGEFLTVFAEEVRKVLHTQGITGAAESFAVIKEIFDAKVAAMKEEQVLLAGRTERAFAFIERCFGDSGEMLVAVTEMTVNPDAAAFIAEHGCPTYFKYQKKFMLYERNEELRRLVGRVD